MHRKVRCHQRDRQYLSVTNRCLLPLFFLEDVEQTICNLPSQRRKRLCLISILFEIQSEILTLVNAQHAIRVYQ